MINRIYCFFVLFAFIFTSCHSQTTKEKNTDTNISTQTSPAQEPNYNYVVEAPDEWTIRDTIMQDGLRIRFLIAPQSLRTDYPAVNVIIASMEGRNIDDFTSRNMNYLKTNMAGITILESGNINSTNYKGQWFTYTKEQNGVARDMINYIIPLNGFAYMITCGSNKGSINKYRATFDNIAKSFKG
jgi:hypothetical protein